MKFLRLLWRILCCIVYALSLPPRWFGYGLRWCFGWVKYPWRRLPAGFRTAVASVYASLPVRLLRWVVFVVACLLFWVLFLAILVLVLALCGVLGPIILRLAPPIARSVGYELAIRECVVKPLDDDIHVAGLRLDTLGSPRVGSDSPLVSLEAFRVAPLSGYVRLDALRVANPDTFIFSQASGDYYAKTPLLDLRLVELKVDMGTLLEDELVIELIRVHGLHALYALDQGTDNVSALVAQLVPLDEDLNVALAIPQVGKAGLAHNALGHHAACQMDGDAGIFLGGKVCEFLLQLRGVDVHGVLGNGKGVVSGGDKVRQLLTANLQLVAERHFGLGSEFCHSLALTRDGDDLHGVGTVGGVDREGLAGGLAHHAPAEGGVVGELAFHGVGLLGAGDAVIGAVALLVLHGHGAAQAHTAGGLVLVLDDDGVEKDVFNLGNAAVELGLLVFGGIVLGVFG